MVLLNIAVGVVACSQVFIDLVNVLRRISGQLNTIGHTFASARVGTDAPEDA